MAIYRISYNVETVSIFYVLIMRIPQAWFWGGGGGSDHILCLSQEFLLLYSSVPYLLG